MEHMFTYYVINEYYIFNILKMEGWYYNNIKPDFIKFFYTNVNLKGILGVRKCL